MSKQLLLIIDPQNDFCDIPKVELPVVARTQRGSVVEVLTETPALAVTGADADMKRLAGFIKAAAPKLSRITVTLDSHPVVAIERPTFWRTGEGGDVRPFTQITAAEVVAGEFLPRDESLRQVVIDLLGKLEAAGRYKLMVWPSHCVTGTWGHNIHRDVAKALAQWEAKSLIQVQKVLKGQYPLVEHYGVFEAETPLDDVPSTQFNFELAKSLTEGVERVFIAGEALSHCVRASVEQLQRYISLAQIGPELVLLSDCASSVTGFESNGLEFIESFRAAGGKVMTIAQAIETLGC